MKNPLSVKSRMKKDIYIFFNSSFYRKISREKVYLLLISAHNVYKLHIVKARKLVFVNFQNSNIQGVPKNTYIFFKFNNPLVVMKNKDEINDAF